MEKWNRVSLVPDLKSMPNLDAAYKLLASHHKAWLVWSIHLFKVFSSLPAWYLDI